jgi:hypothetical protein
MRKGVPDKQMKALAMAFAGAVLAAVATMFVPAALLGAFTGATGLSELVPAAAAPLGDTARAIIAFGAGALTLAILAYLLLRQENAPSAVTESALADNRPDAVSFKDRLARFAMPKMPWAKSENDITDLADLPKLRNGDIHPDAPPRRPLSAHHDLPVLDLAVVATSAVDVEEIKAIEVPEIRAADDVGQDAFVEPQMVAEPIALTVPVGDADIQPTLAEMVAQLEAAVAERQQQLAELEAVAAQLGAGQNDGQVEEHAAVDNEVIEPVRTERPMLEAVPTSVKDDDMDSALAAALATLHRMNGTDR